MTPRATRPRSTKSRVHAAAVTSLVRFGVPGAAAALVERGDLAWSAGWGVREADAGGSVDPARTLFQAASLSKVIAALVALRLVAAGVLDLDEDILRRLESWQLPYIDVRPRITLRHLLAHTSGIGIDHLPGYPAGSDVPTLAEVLRGEPPATTPEVTLEHLPGLRFEYSGAGYCVLEQVLTDATGSDYGELARELVFEPVGMVSSRFIDNWSHAPADIAYGHRAGATQLRGGWHTYPERAAAGLWSTVEDLARLIIAIQQCCAGELGALLPQSLAREMMSSQSPGGEWGLGLDLRGASASRFGHDGFNEGYRCTMAGFLQSRGGWVVMTNSDLGCFVIDAIVRCLIHDGFRGERQGDVQSLKAWIGAYHVESGGRLEIAIRADELQLNLDGHAAARLTMIDRRKLAARGFGLTLLRSDPSHLVIRRERDGVELHASKLADTSHRGDTTIRDAEGPRFVAGHSGPEDGPIQE